MKSKFLQLNWKDAVKGFAVAALTAAIAGVYESLQLGSLPTLAQLKTAGLAGLAAGAAYLLKNLFSGEKAAQ